MENKGQNALLFCGLLLVVSAMTPARAWIRYFNTISWAISLMVLCFSGKYSKAIPQGFLFSAITYFIVRICLGLLKQTGGLVALSVQFLNAGLLLFVPVVVFLAIVAFADYRQFRRFVVAMVLIMLPFLLKTISVPIGTSRMNMATAELFGNYDLMQAVYETNRSGVMDYAQCHSLPFLVVSSVVLARHLKNVRERMVAAILASILVVTIVRSGFGYAICVTLALVFLVFAGAKKRTSSFLLLVLFGIMGLVLVKSGFFSSILTKVQNGLGYENVIGEKAGEVNAIIQGRTDDATDFSGRIELYKLGIMAFVRHPLFGAPPTVWTGGHSYWFDTLGQWGLAGFIVEAVMLATAFRLERRILPSSRQYYFDITFVFYMLILCVKSGAPQVQLSTFFLLFTAMLIYREDDFYFASNKVRQLFNIPPRMFGQPFLQPKR